MASLRTIIRRYYAHMSNIACVDKKKKRLAVRYKRRLKKENIKKKGDSMLHIFSYKGSNFEIIELYVACILLVYAVWENTLNRLLPLFLRSLCNVALQSS